MACSSVVPDRYNDIIIISLESENETVKKLQESIKESQYLQRKNGGIEIKVDLIEDVLSGGLALEGINEALDNTPMVLILLSKDLSNDPMVKEKICMALQKTIDDKQSRKLITIPVYSPARRDITYYDQLPSFITNKHSLDFNAGELDRFMEKLWRTINTQNVKNRKSEIIKRLMFKESTNVHQQEKKNTEMDVEMNKMSLQHAEEMQKLMAQLEKLEAKSSAQTAADRGPAQMSGVLDPTQGAADHGPAQMAAVCDPTQGAADHGPAQMSGVLDPTQGAADRGLAQMAAVCDPTQGAAGRDPTQGAADRDPTQGAADRGLAQTAAGRDPTQPCMSADQQIECPSVNTQAIQVTSLGMEEVTAVVDQLYIGSRDQQLEDESVNLMKNYPASPCSPDTETGNTSPSSPLWAARASELSAQTFAKQRDLQPNTNHGGGEPSMDLTNLQLCDFREEQDNCPSRESDPELSCSVPATPSPQLSQSGSATQVEHLYVPHQVLEGNRTLSPKCSNSILHPRDRIPISDEPSNPQNDTVANESAPKNFYTPISFDPKLMTKNSPPSSGALPSTQAQLPTFGQILDPVDSSLVNITSVLESPGQ